MYDLLGDRLRELPRLESLTIYSDITWNDQCHGLPWSTLHSILSVPHLREFKLKYMSICPTLRDGEEPRGDFSGHLTSFHYQLHHPRQPWSYPQEIAALAVILKKLCDSLETLVLMSESAPLSTMATLRWPRLRKMVFYGTPLAEPSVRACFGMKRLHCLSLRLNPTRDAMPQPIWPAGHDGAFPWPELECLTVSYPEPQDDIYNRLPSSLRSLSLRCWYHQHHQWYLARDDVVEIPMTELLLTSSALLSILRRCSTLHLEHVEIEYAADSEDDALLSYVATTFPHLVELKIHRYRSTATSNREPDASVVGHSSPSSASLLCARSHLSSDTYRTIACAALEASASESVLGLEYQAG